jgi:hypothetical protein
MTKRKTIKDIKINNDWECNNCDKMNSEDNPYCISCDNERYNDFKDERELKLLKEIKCISGECACCIGSDNISDGTMPHEVSVEDLRKEAIKWIKADESSNQLEEACETSDTFGTVSWIKHFFNITDEDLK